VKRLTEKPRNLRDGWGDGSLVAAENSDKKREVLAPAYVRGSSTQPE